MPLRRLIWWLSGTALAGLGLVWAATGETPPAIPATEPVVGVPYAVEIHSERCTFDLNFDVGTRYFVAVSSLGTAAQSCTVTIESKPVDRATLKPYQPAESLDTRRETEETPAAASPVLNMPILPTRNTTTSNRRFENSSTTGLPPRTFHLHAADGNLDDEKQYAAVPADIIAEGDHVRIYLDRQESHSRLVPGVVEEIIRLFDREIIPCQSRRLGTFRDIDGDGKFSVLLSPWLDRLQGGRTSLGGFVRGSDFRTDVEVPFSNRCDMMYLNSNVRPGPHLKSLIAHEYAHAVSFSERLSQPCGDELLDEEDWLNEAIAHCAENICEAGWSNLDYRVSRYLNDTSRYALVVPDYYRAGLWRDHGCRGATYLFLRWCVDQYGEELLPALLHSTDRGVENLERATGQRFEDLFRRWSLALIMPRAVPENMLAGSHALFRSVEPYGRLSTWGLIGPRTTRCPETCLQSIDLKGTSTAFLELDSARTPGARRITLNAEPGMKLQVSLIRSLDGDTAPLAEARWIATKSMDAAKPANSMLEVRLSGARPVTGAVSMIGCEWNSGEDKQSCCFTADELRAFSMAAQRSSDTEPAAIFQLPMPNAAKFRADLIVKVLIEPASGPKDVAWATLPAPLRVPAQAQSSDRHDPLKN